MENENQKKKHNSKEDDPLIQSSSSSEHELITTPSTSDFSSLPGDINLQNELRAQRNRHILIGIIVSIIILVALIMIPFAYKKIQSKEEPLSAVVLEHNDYFIALQYGIQSPKDRSSLLAMFDFDSTLGSPEQCVRNCPDPGTTCLSKPICGTEEYCPSINWGGYREWRPTFEACKKSPVPQVLSELYDSGYRIVVISNQAGLSTSRGPCNHCIGRDRDAKSSDQKIKDFIEKISELGQFFQSRTGKIIPFLAVCSLKKEVYKPRTNLFEFFLSRFHHSIPSDKINCTHSFYTGDAANRTAGALTKPFNNGTDYIPGCSACDLQFAWNMGVQFYTPEEVFLGRYPLLLKSAQSYGNEIFQPGSISESEFPGKRDNGYSPQWCNNRPYDGNYLGY